MDLMGGDMSELDPCDTFRAAAVKGDPFESPPENSDDPFNAAPVKTTTSHTRTSLRQWCSKAIPRMTDWTSTVAASCAGDLSDELVALDNLPSNKGRLLDEWNLAIQKFDPRVNEFTCPCVHPLVGAALDACSHAKPLELSALDMTALIARVRMHCLGNMNPHSARLAPSHTRAGQLMQMYFSGTFESCYASPEASETTWAGDFHLGFVSTLHLTGAMEDWIYVTDLILHDRILEPWRELASPLIEKLTEAIESQERTVVFERPFFLNVVDGNQFGLRGTYFNGIINYLLPLSRLGELNEMTLRPLNHFVENDNVTPDPLLLRELAVPDYYLVLGFAGFDRCEPVHVARIFKKMPQTPIFCPAVVPTITVQALEVKMGPREESGVKRPIKIVRNVDCCLL